MVKQDLLAQCITWYTVYGQLNNVKCKTYTYLYDGVKDVFYSGFFFDTFFKYLRMLQEI